MQISGKTMRNEKLASFYMILASILLSTHGRSILQDTSFGDQELAEQDDHTRQEQDDLIQNKLSPAEINYLVMNQLREHSQLSMEDNSLVPETKRAAAPNKDTKQRGKFQIVVRPVLTPQTWLRICRSRSKSVRFPGCNNDMMRDRQKREELLRNNLAALLSGLKGSEGRQRLRMPSLRFG